MSDSKSADEHTPPFCPIPSLQTVMTRSFIRFQDTQGARSSWGVETRGLDIYECPVSGLRLRNPADVVNSDEYYGAGYHNRMGSTQLDARRQEASRRENLYRIQVLRRQCPSGRVMDVGCSLGVLAGQMAQAGYDVLASDISEYAVARARELLGADRVFLGRIEALSQNLPEQSLDAVTLMDVIEHFDDLVSPLRAINRLLKSQGVLMIRTPCLSSLFFKLADWMYFITGGRAKRAAQIIYHSDHLFFFSGTSIRRLLEETGFEVVTLQSDPLLWVNFASAELHHGALANGVIGALYWLGRLIGRGHGMLVMARKK
ncbi:MAG: class I SAM-dependent methyltransferase [Candidatus Sumerlaeota bacterium]|nr:class I SAM-dependent methyltransferase [Candidatus Sumerlaeota bacterium]